MNYTEMESIIESFGHPLQHVLYAALTIEEIETIGGGCSRLNIGGTGRGDPARLLDMALSVTKHIREGEHGSLRQWVESFGVEPQGWPRVVVKFWHRVPYEAARDMARISGEIV